MARPVGKEPLSPDAALGLRALERHDLLLMTDARLPCLVALIAGGPVRGSWWGHPKGKRIFAAGLELEDHRDVAAVKLVSGKATFVHRRLWPALLAVATAREPWQIRGLPAAARRLLDRVAAAGRLRAAALRGGRESARALEERLLVHARSVHTESGAHELELESWSQWSAARGVTPSGDGRLGRTRLEDALRRIEAATGGSGKLPWQ